MEDNQLRNLFDNPNINVWHTLSRDDYLEFIRYVFQRAGCTTSPFPDRGADLVIYEGKKVIAYVAVQNGVSLVGGSAVVQLAGIDVETRVPRYLITTGDFAKPAKEEAEKRQRLKLVNGTRLKRYVDYIYGIRFKDSNAPATRLDLIFEADHTLDQIKKSKTQVLVIANNKGGVGKTTTALNISYGLARRGRRVLAVDMDPQSNLTLALLQAETHVDVHFGHYIERQRSLGEMVRKTQFEGICTIPAHSSMRLAFVDMKDWSQRELNFAEELLQPTVTQHPENGPDPFNWIVIDTPPDMGFFTRCALAASNYVLIPVAPDISSSTGTENIINTVRSIQALIGGEFRVNILGAFITKYDNTQKTAERVAALIDPIQQNGVEIFQTPIHEDNNVQRGYDESTKRSQHKPIDLFAREGRAGADYQKLLTEMLDHVSYP